MYPGGDYLLHGFSELLRLVREFRYFDADFVSWYEGRFLGFDCELEVRLSVCMCFHYCVVDGALDDLEVLVALVVR